MTDRHLPINATEGSAPIRLTDIHGDGSEFAQAVDVLSTPAASFPDISTISRFEVDDDPQVILASASATRLGVSIYNNSDTPLYVSQGEAVSDTLFTVKMPAYSFYELDKPVFRGVITAVRPTGSALASATVTETYKDGVL